MNTENNRNDFAEERQAFIKWAVRNQYDISEINTFDGVLFKRQSTTDAWLGWLYSAKEKVEKLERCVESSVWVATDFLLPDEGELVLFIDNHNVIHEGFISTDYVDGPYGENSEDLGGNKTLWSSNSNGWELLPEEVKYWMKRPNNPVEAVRGGNE